eukprot:scaffold222403_cov31-Tisochrysis_lutea.AAC.1
MRVWPSSRRAALLARLAAFRAALAHATACALFCIDRSLHAFVSPTNWTSKSWVASFIGCFCADSASAGAMATELSRTTVPSRLTSRTMKSEYRCLVAALKPGPGVQNSVIPTCAGGNGVITTPWWSNLPCNGRARDKAREGESGEGVNRRAEKCLLK